jgi:sensor domain CHASE-containing protein
MITERKIVKAYLVAMLTASILVCFTVYAEKTTNSDTRIQRVVTNISCDIDSCKPQNLSIKLHPKHPRYT